MTLRNNSIIIIATLVMSSTFSLGYFFPNEVSASDEICIRCPPGEGDCKIIPCPAEMATTAENTTTTDNITSTPNNNTYTLTVANQSFMFDNRTVISAEDGGGGGDGGTEDTCYKCPKAGGGCKPIPCPAPS